jgi:hypothetical protein
MATELQTYDKCWLSIKGRLLEEQVRVQIQAVDSDTQEDILEGGGEFPATLNIPSVRRLILSWEMALPIENPQDLDLWADYQSSDRIKIAVQLVGSGKTLSTEGVVREPTIESRVNSVTTFSCSALCDFKLFQ